MISSGASQDFTFQPPQIYLLCCCSSAQLIPGCESEPGGSCTLPGPSIPGPWSPTLLAVAAYTGSWQNKLATACECSHFCIQKCLSPLPASTYGDIKADGENLGLASFLLDHPNLRTYTLSVLDQWENKTPAPSTTAVLSLKASVHTWFPRFDWGGHQEPGTSGSHEMVEIMILRWMEWSFQAYVSSSPWLWAWPSSSFRTLDSSHAHLGSNPSFCMSFMTQRIVN